MVDAVEAYSQVSALTADAVVSQYAPLVKRIAHHLIGRLPKSVQVDDLIQAGMIGLLEASKNYDTSKGASFETYAGIRVRGHMLDEVRRNDWLPRSVYRNSRKISEAVRIVENRHGHDAKDSDIAVEMGISLDDYYGLLREVNSGQLFGYDDVGVSDDILDAGFGASMEDPLSSAQREDFHRVLTDAIDHLPQREKLVLSLYYDEELNLKEIGAVLGVSESRVSQIHSQAMCRIQARIPEWKR
jgi:RNA polymerase sigma factor FliA